jgi:hypothetical protein
MKSLTRPERNRLLELESAVEAGLQTFHAVGRALLEIRDSRLYRSAYKTFEEYCRQRWGFSRQHALRLIDAADVQEDLTPIGVTLGHESQARELVPLDPQQRRDVAQEAHAGGSTTAARLRNLTAKALASLPPEEQRELVEASEAKIMAGRPKQVGGEDRSGRLGQIGRLTKRVRKLVEGLGGDGEDALVYLGHFELAIGRVAA